jgi:hypothetical protein
LNSFSSTNSFEDQKIIANWNKPDNAMQFEHSNHGFNTTGFTKNRFGYGDEPDADSESVGAATAEIKTRVETALSRLKTEAAMSEIDDAKAANNGDVGAQRGGGGETASPSGAPSMAGSSTVKSVKAELERRRKEFFAQALEAENKAREAEEKHKQVESRLAQEIEKRQLAEQRLKELEDEHLKSLSTIEAAEFKLLEVQVALEESEGRLKEAENLIKKTEARAGEESVKCALAESKAEEAALALAAADQKCLEVETRAQAAEENAREIKRLIAEAESIALETHEKYKAAEARLKHEIEQRILTDQKLKSFGAEITSYLEQNWTKNESGESQTGTTTPGVEATETLQNRHIQQIRAELENEQKARIAAEKARAEAEAKLVKLEKMLPKAEKKHSQAPASAKNEIREHGEPSRSRPKEVARSSELPTEYSLIESSDDNSILSINEQIAGVNRIKLLSYSAIIALLLLALFWLALEAYFKI